MGLFKSIAGGAGIGTAFKLGGKLLGLGSGGAQMFHPSQLKEFKQMQEDVNRVRGYATGDVDTLRKSADINLQQLEADRARTLGGIQAGSVGRFGAMQDALARQGGVDSGSRERLAMQSQRDATLAKQSAMGDFGRMASDIRSQDFGAQEAFKNQAIMAMPQMSQIPLNIQMNAAAANMRAAQQAKANKAAALGGLGQLAGMGVGAMVGGPMGAQLGGALGGGLFSSFA